MKSPEIKVCPSCDNELQPIPDGRENFVAECDWCGFFASTRDIAHANYLVNFDLLSDIRLPG